MFQSLHSIMMVSFFMLGLPLLTSCSQPKPDEVLARVGDETITVGSFQDFLRQELNAYPKEITKNREAWQGLKQRALQENIERRLLLKEALKRGTEVREEELNQEIQRFKSRYTEISFQNMLQETGLSSEDWETRKKENLIIKKFLETSVTIDVPITEEAVRKYYEEHPEEFQQPESVRVRQIVTDSKEKAEAILRRLRRGENFAKLARDLSLSPDRKQGGDLGHIVKGSYPREFEVCFTMKPGEISPIIPSAYGFHLFKVLEKAPAKQLSYEKAEAKIAWKLKMQARQQGRTMLLERLKAEHKVEIREEILERISL